MASGHFPEMVLSAGGTFLGGSDTIQMKKTQNLDEKGIEIENNEKDGYDEDEAIIYGSDYDKIADGIRSALKSWNRKQK